MMKNSNRHWIITLGLATALALPGLAMADGWNRPPQKYPDHHQAQQWHGHDGYRGRDFARRGDRDRHEWREHQRYRHFDRDAYREHEWREHEWREHARRYYGYVPYNDYRVYPGAYWSGFYVSPSVGLVIDLR